MTYSLFLGCNIPARVPQYDAAARAVLEQFDVTVVDNDEYKCCGYPMQNTSFRAYLLSAARNLALAEQQQLDMILLCKCCFGSLKKAAYLLQADAALKDEINGLLDKEGLIFSGTNRILHLLSVLYEEVGVEAVKAKVVRPFSELNIATHYGCHALRPSDVTQFDDPVEPVVFDALVEATGAKSVDWSLKLDCCGAPLLGANDGLSTDLSGKKLMSARQAGANYLCTACPWCQLQFDHVQASMGDDPDADRLLPSILYPQLLGLSMNLSDNALGISLNRLDASGLEDSLLQEKQQ